MWQRWMSSYPELELLDLDIAQGKDDFRTSRTATFFTLLFMPPDERALARCLRALAEGDMTEASLAVEQEAAEGALLPDLPLLAGTFMLGRAAFADAAATLQRAYQAAAPAGEATRRLYPGLRILLRISPCLLLPLYPSPYAAALLYAVALWHSGAATEALDVLGDIAATWGNYDELRVVAGQIHIQRGELDRAIAVLRSQEAVERDALELARSLHLAYAYYLREEYRAAARELGGAVKTVRDAGPLLMARARLLLAECCERNGLLLDALRESAHVAVDEVPGDVADAMRHHEERWITELGLLSGQEIERLARADNYQIYLPDATQTVSDHSPLDTTRDPMKNLKPREQSWLKRQAEERKISALKAAAARGERSAAVQQQTLSGLGRETRQSIAAAQRWWPARQAELQGAAPRERLARPTAGDVGHARFDFCGTREAEPFLLQGEKRAALAGYVTTAAVLLAILLLMIRSCVY